MDHKEGAEHRGILHRPALAQGDPAALHVEGNAEGAAFVDAEVAGRVVHHGGPALKILRTVIPRDPHGFLDSRCNVVVLGQQQLAGKTVLPLGQSPGSGRVRVVAGDPDHPAGVLIYGQVGQIRDFVYVAGKIFLERRRLRAIRHVDGPFLGFDHAVGIVVHSLNAVVPQREVGLVPHHPEERSALRIHGSHFALLLVQRGAVFAEYLPQGLDLLLLFFTGFNFEDVVKAFLAEDLIHILRKDQIRSLTNVIFRIKQLLHARDIIIRKALVVGEQIVQRQGFYVNVFVRLNPVIVPVGIVLGERRGCFFRHGISSFFVCI